MRLREGSDSTRKLSGLAATIGRAFTLDVLARAHDGDEAQSQHSCQEVQSRLGSRADRMVTPAEWSGGLVDR